MTKFFGKVKNFVKNFDIYDKSKILFIVPLVVVLVMIVCGLCYEFNTSSYDKFANIGVDFQGGTLLTVDFKQPGMNSGSKYNDNLALINEALEENGLTASVVQSSGDSAIIVRYLNTVKVGGQLVDYSTDEKVAEMNTINDKVKSDISEKVAVKYAGAVEVESTTSLIGNTSSMRLLRTALISVAVALALMLVYIVIRFDLYSALAAIVALIHDILIMMCFTVIFYVEIGSTIVAAIITIVAYSINNTIIVFDKIRATVKPYKKSHEKFDIGLVINKSVRATLTRTLFTTFTTLIVIVLLAALGVASIRTFALPIIFGLIGGFYSSVFLAGPMWGIFKGWGEKIKVAYKNRKFKKAKQLKKAVA
ncbi:MAG: protein translocase subunit SecF [Clostridia bacterium]|nr:protein translocase subunit SecF [Clostridia bacterium]